MLENAARRRTQVPGIRQAILREASATLISPFRHQCPWTGLRRANHRRTGIVAYRVWEPPDLTVEWYQGTGRLVKGKQFLGEPSGHARRRRGLPHLSMMLLRLFLPCTRRSSAHVLMPATGYERSGEKDALSVTDLKRIRAQIAAWRDDLVSMSRRNKLLYFSHTKASSLELTQPDPPSIVRLLGTRPYRLDFYDAPTAKGVDLGDAAADRRVREPKVNEIVTSVRGEGSTLVAATPERLRATLRTLRRAASQEYLDKGIRSLYLACGMLTWFEGPETEEPCYAPLLLIPVELRHEAANVADPLYRLLDDDAVINPALAIKLEADFGLRLPSIDEYDDLDVERLQRDIRTLVSAQSGWSVEDRVVMGRFSFHKDVMYRDLLENEDSIAEQDFICALVDNVTHKADYTFDEPDDDHVDETIEPEAMHSILDADASQRKCIWAATQGKTFAMDGPPGTGKSQTIANMICELITVGKTVLFVSEKAAALEVVYKRLQAQGLHEYVLQLHSSEATRRGVAQELGRSLERRPSLSQRMSVSHIESLREDRRSLSSYADAMNAIRKPLGRSLHSVIGRLTQMEDVPATVADVDIACDLDGTRLETMLATASRLGRAWGPVERGDDFVWRGTTQSNATAAERRRTEEALRDLVDKIDAVGAECSCTSSALGLPPASTLLEAGRAVALLTFLHERRAVAPSWFTEDGLKSAASCLEEVEKLCDARRSAALETQVQLGAGASAEQLVGLGKQMASIFSSLSCLHMPISIKYEASAQDVGALSEEVGRRLENLGGDLVERLDAVCRRLDVEADSIDVQLAEELLGLPCLTDAADRPMTNWLDSAELEVIRRERVALGAMVTSYRDKYERVRAVFADEILTLPVSDLALRFSTVHRGLGALRGAHRRDRKMLKPVCRVGRVTRDAIGMLSTASELKDLATQMSTWERKHAATFGIYYAHKETDFAALDHALKSAESAVEAAVRRPELSKSIRFLVRGADIDLKTRQEIGTLRQHFRAVTTLPSFTRGGLGNAVGVPDRAPVAVIVQDLQRAHQLLEQLRVMFDRVSAAGATFETVGGLRDGLRSVDKLEEALQTMEAKTAQFRESLADKYSAFDTDIGATKADLTWCGDVIATLPCRIDAQEAKRLLESRVAPEPLARSTSACEDAVDGVLKVFEASRAATLRKSTEGSLRSTRDLASRLIETLDDIAEWCEYQDALRELNDEGLEGVAEFCVESGPPADKIAQVFERRILEVWADAVISLDKGLLDPQRSVERDSLVKRFRELDQNLVRLSAGAVMEACNARRPKTALGSAAIIHREAEKKSRHMPIRNLLSATRDMTQALKPCFMMSPLSVSQYLGPDFRFDAVIFDEASQIRPHDAINCLYRGSQHIVAGDQKQLPPTSFFDAHSDDGDEWVEDQVEVYESILDKVKACGAVPSMSLKWHYRSRHEDLITFSNYSFYDGRLITFPSPSDAAPPLGIGFTLVPGVYRRGAQRDNQIEARKVAEIVALYIRELPDLSVGVVAFSQAQQEAIENAIDELRARDSSLPSAPFSGDRLDGLFIKNLETVQGDERDVIILSIGYGPDENGKLTMSFGPINSAGGYRRLNVAVTRARMRVEVVSSIRATDISDTATNNEGVRHLRKYLEYAESGPKCLAFDGPQSLGEMESPFEAEVARTIRSWGYDVVPQVGTAGYRIDLGVRHNAGPGGFALGVECDGAAYHSSRAARDRDRLREAVLCGLGWRLHRIWGTSWYHQRRAEEKRLRAAIEAAIAECSSRKARATNHPAELAAMPKVVVKDISLPTSLNGGDWVVDYRVAGPTLYVKEQGISLGDPAAQLALCRLIPQIVEVEQPIHTSLLQDRLLEAWGSGRAGSRIQQNIETVLRRLAREKSIERDKAGFVRLVGALAVKSVRRPATGDPRTERSAMQVPSEEYELAVRKCMELAPGITRDDLSVQVASALGWERRGREIAAAIGDAIDAAEKATGV